MSTWRPELHAAPGPRRARASERSPDRLRHDAVAHEALPALEGDDSVPCVLVERAPWGAGGQVLETHERLLQRAHEGTPAPVLERGGRAHADGAALSLLWRHHGPDAAARSDRLSALARRHVLRRQRGGGAERGPRPYRPAGPEPPLGTGGHLAARPPRPGVRPGEQPYALAGHRLAARAQRAAQRDCHGERVVRRGEIEPDRLRQDRAGLHRRGRIWHSLRRERREHAPPYVPCGRRRSGEEAVEHQPERDEAHRGCVARTQVQAVGRIAGLDPLRAVEVDRERHVETGRVQLEQQRRCMRPRRARSRRAQGRIRRLELALQAHVQAGGRDRGSRNRPDALARRLVERRREPGRCVDDDAGRRAVGIAELDRRPVLRIFGGHHHAGREAQSGWGQESCEDDRSGDDEPSEHGAASFLAAPHAPAERGTRPPAAPDDGGQWVRRSGGPAQRVGSLDSAVQLALQAAVTLGTLQDRLR